MSYQVKYELVRSRAPIQGEPRIDRMTPVTTLHRIAQVACEKILLMMNNTELLYNPRLRSMEEALMYLQGNHADVGLSGDRGDLYRRKLAEQMYLNFRIQGVDHNNVMVVVAAALGLEKQTRGILSDGASNRDLAPPILIDDQVLNILARIADVF